VDSIRTRPSLLWLGVLLGVGAMLPNTAAAKPAKTETIVMIRHGEKPALGLGQLDCQGLNRALALPAVIGKTFGRPDAIFAPDPAKMKKDHGQPYDYVRPLATIEPTAIAFGLPVDASIGVSDIETLKQKIEAPAYQGAFVLVAWEHNEIVKLARALLAGHGADPTIVPEWDGRDYDSVYVVRITKAATATFERRRQGLDGQPTSCPGFTP
jgi:hypothetical protein